VVSNRPEHQTGTRRNRDQALKPEPDGTSGLAGVAPAASMPAPPARALREQG